VIHYHLGLLSRIDNVEVDDSVIDTDSRIRPFPKVPLHQVANDIRTG